MNTQPVASSQQPSANGHQPTVLVTQPIEVHFTQLNILGEYDNHLAHIEELFNDIKAAGQPLCAIENWQLFILEGMGYTVDLATGMVTK